MRFQTEIKHNIPDLRSASINEEPTVYSPISFRNRATSCEPQTKELFGPEKRANISENHSRFDLIEYRIWSILFLIFQIWCIL